MNRTLYIYLLFTLLFSKGLVAQVNNQTLYHFKFYIADKSELAYLTQIISIDNVKNDTVYAYANNAEFANFQSLQINYSLIADTKSTKEFTMASSLSEMANWDKYPSYELYEEMMQNFANQYPNLCILEEIGTLASGRKLLAIKISDFPEQDNESEPEVFLSSTIHGDETGGYIVLMRLIDHLLNNYNSDTTNNNTSQLINNCEIWINPLANPDGTYKAGNNSLSGAMRYNGNFVDLNRNFPDPAAGENPDGYAYQEETLLMMAFANKHNFSMGMNIHGGIEVVNYPWDTWSRITADDAWWQYVGGNYRDSAQANSAAGYMEDLSNGLTNGFEWYRITGGRQDYMNYFQHCREFTLEISGIKLYPSADLPQLWEANKNALLGYISESQYGIHGQLTDNNGESILAKIEILNHDFDNSEVYSDSTNGFFTRYLKAGTYSLGISANGFMDTVIEGITVIDGMQTQLSAILNKIPVNICLDTTTLVKKTYSSIIDSIVFPLTNCGQLTQTINIQLENADEYSWISNETPEITLIPQQKLQALFYLKNLPNKDTIYHFNISISTDSIIIIPLQIELSADNRIVCHKKAIKYTLPSGTQHLDSVQIENLGNLAQTITPTSTSSPWLQIANNEITLPPAGTRYLKYSITAAQTQTGYYTDYIEFVNEPKLKIPIKLIVDTLPIVQLKNFNENISIIKNSSFIDTFFITNAGGGTLAFELNCNDEALLTKLEFSPKSGLIQKSDSQAIQISIFTDKMEVGNYNTQLTLAANTSIKNLPLNITIDTLPKLFVSTDTVHIKGIGKGIFKDSILVQNIGGNKLIVSAFEVPTQGYQLVKLPEIFSLVAAQATSYIPIAIDANKMESGNYQSSLSLNDEIIPIAFHLQNPPKLLVNKNAINLIVTENSLSTDTLFLTNSGESGLKYWIETDAKIEWINTPSLEGEISPGETFPLVISINSTGINPQLYRTKLSIHGVETTRLPLIVKVIPVK